MRTFVHCASVLLAAWIGSLLPAQAGNCSRTMAQTVPTRQDNGLIQDCGTLTVKVSGFEVGTPATGCPLFIVYTPEHEVMVPSPNDTETRTYSHVPILLLKFECKTSRFLWLIPVGSSCVHRGHDLVGTLPRMVTVACPRDTNADS